MADQSPTESDSSTTPEFPDKMRVHALAKLLGVTSKQVLAEAAALGTELRSAQSSLQRDVAHRIHASLTSASEAIEPVVAELDTLIDPVVEAPAAETPAEQPAAESPAEKPVRARRSRKKVVVPEPAAEEAVDPAVAEINAGLDAAAALQSKEAEQSDLFTSFEAPQTHQPEVAPAAPQVPLFLQPDLEAAEVAPRRRRARREPAAPAAVEEKQTTAEAETVAPEASPVAVPAVEEPAVTAPQTEGESAESEDEDDDQPRRRRRGRRGRGRGRGEQGGEQGSEQGSDEESDTTTEAEQETAPEAVGKQTEDASGGESGNKTESDADADAESENADDSDLDADGSSRRRRRRRRRKTGTDGAADATATSEDDPPNTVVHEREPRNKTRVKDEVQGISGSTRLEAKRQRRRDGRDAGRRRPPILTESEFLARREAVDRVMVVRDRADSGQPHATTQVAVLEDGVLVEHFVTNSASASMVGNVYLGRVQNVLPSMEAAFIDIGRGRNGVLYAGEVNWEAAGLGGNSRKIEQALKPGDQVLVQVSKDPVGHKGARLTTQISLAGRFLVYVPGGTSTGISRKLPDTERKRLKEILRDIVPADAGVIIRTASEGVSEEELARDVTRLQAQWAGIEEQAAAADTGKSGNPQALYEEPDMLVKVIRDLFNEDFTKLVIEGEKAHTTVENYINSVAPDLLPRLEKYTPTSNIDVFQARRIDEQLAKALDRKVWLPSGGTLVIDRTEAMTVVDVNTGKFTGAGGNLEETVTRNNLEAAEEIVRQMRLRDIGGMIVVDFIDMVLESNRDLVLRRLTECLGRDRTRHQVSEVTSLGLVQMTRKKLGTGLVEAFSTTCEHCHGRGIIVHSEPVEVKSSDDGGSRSGSQRSESGTSRKNKRGRGDKSASTESNGQEAPAPEVPAVDATVKRAHPVALAMASHHHDDDETVAADSIEFDSAGTSSGDDASKSADRQQDRPIDTPAATERPDAPVVDSAAEEAPAGGDEREEAPRGRRRSRRASRAASAPVAEAAPEVGTVFVIPTPDPVAEAVAEIVPAPATEAPATEAPATEAPAEEEVVVVKRPRRRRAAARPAGPPVDGE
ncbi:translation initiation factor IF-2 N-terminal domain-containing protein [Rhodococcus sp. IEGM 1409]|uniref:translation initiation factor IF-2 N-terminal domain-containing protein n=1 Tax=Rhodococcus sp. IEGM 1409 TaxID=3047082 RepID=UPI0024B82276|nr:translation initiation factor IF-2 N-terminal domain-containing protein [Rhodococcus sp. IEGM 1409]MDI9900322.1 translation initiation factor IF-2 N-terminal domain-containing protein [Rhodococcus sp. IEGM 1409]